jgi:hypothetical protein
VTGDGLWPPGHASRRLGGDHAGGGGAPTALQRRGKAWGLPLGPVNSPVLVAWSEAGRGLPPTCTRGKQGHSLGGEAPRWPEERDADGELTLGMEHDEA